MRFPVSRDVRFVDLCAGLGCFHQALKYVQSAGSASGSAHFKCVLAAELDRELREVYVRNFPDIAGAYAEEYPYHLWVAHRDRLVADLGGLADELDLYDHQGNIRRIHGDIGALIDESRERLRKWPTGKIMLPEHDLLCAGFPCQPFSKSGAQRGFHDVNGTVFHLISIILKERRPGFVLLENVGNFERHDSGNTWARVKEILADLGYEFRATTHVGGQDGGTGLISPHHIGLPHHRERFFIAARHRKEDRLLPFSMSSSPFPTPARKTRKSGAEAELLNQKASATLTKIISSSVNKATDEDFHRSHVFVDRLRCIAHWQSLLDKIAEHDKKSIGNAETLIQPMPSFPIWGFELDLWNHYPISSNPQNHLRVPKIFNNWRQGDMLSTVRELGLRGYGPTGERAYLKKKNLSREDVARFKESMPAYAISRDEWPDWKRRFLEQNREWALRLWRGLNPEWLRLWLDELYLMQPSHQKLEWNCQGEALDLWQTILQFRPSGLRAKRFAHVPALVAMTTTQLPLVPRLVNEPGAGRGLPAKVRHLLPIEALQLQGLPADWKCPASRESTFHALGNAVNAELVADIFSRWFSASATTGSHEERTLTLVAGSRGKDRTTFVMRA